MELSKKVKTALDETRMLILGAQILLGFELRSAFSEGFDKLPGHAKHIEALALILMTISVALMIAPGLYHRIVEGGRVAARACHQHWTGRARHHAADGARRLSPHRL